MVKEEEDWHEPHGWSLGLRVAGLDFTAAWLTQTAAVAPRSVPARAGLSGGKCGGDEGLASSRMLPVVASRRLQPVGPSSLARPRSTPALPGTGTNQ